MRFSSNIEQVSMSKTAEMADLALSLKEKGHNVINMASGELSYKPAPEIRKEARKTAENLSWDAILENYIDDVEEAKSRCE